MTTSETCNKDATTHVMKIALPVTTKSSRMQTFIHKKRAMTAMSLREDAILFTVAILYCKVWLFPLDIACLLSVVSVTLMYCDKKPETRIARFTQYGS